LGNVIICSGAVVHKRMAAEGAGRQRREQSEDENDDSDVRARMRMGTTRTRSRKVGWERCELSGPPQMRGSDDAVDEDEDGAQDEVVS